MPTLPGRLTIPGVKLHLSGRLRKLKWVKRGRRRQHRRRARGKAATPSNATDVRLQAREKVERRSMLKQKRGSFARKHGATPCAMWPLVRLSH